MLIVNVKCCMAPIPFIVNTYNHVRSIYYTGALYSRASIYYSKTLHRTLCTLLSVVFHRDSSSSNPSLCPLVSAVFFATLASLSIICRETATMLSSINCWPTSSISISRQPQLKSRKISDLRFFGSTLPTYLVFNCSFVNSPSSLTRFS